jgi:hypothetical protein
MISKAAVANSYRINAIDLELEKNFSVQMVNDNHAFASKKVDILATVIQPNSVIRGLKITNLSPYGRINATAASYPMARQLCRDLTYANETEWRLPTLTELEELRQLKYTMLGYAFEDYVTGGTVWVDIPEEGFKKSTRYDTPSEFCYVNLTVQRSTFEISHPEDLRPYHHLNRKVLIDGHEKKIPDEKSCTVLAEKRITAAQKKYYENPGESLFLCVKRESR